MNAKSECDTVKYLFHVEITVYFKVFTTYSFFKIMLILNTKNVKIL